MNLQSQCRGDKTSWLQISVQGWWGNVPRFIPWAPSFYISGLKP